MIVVSAFRTWILVFIVWTFWAVVSFWAHKIGQVVCGVVSTGSSCLSRTIKTFGTYIARILQRIWLVVSLRACHWQRASGNTALTHFTSVSRVTLPLARFWAIVSLETSSLGHCCTPISNYSIRKLACNRFWKQSLINLTFSCGVVSREWWNSIACTSWTVVVWRTDAVIHW